MYSCITLSGKCVITDLVNVIVALDVSAASFAFAVVEVHG